MLNDLALRDDENVISLLKALDKSEFNFVLTGSTFFNGSGNDVDLMVLNDNSIERYLRDLFFVKKTKTSGYEDDESILAVFEHRYLPVHVQIIRNEEYLRAKMAIQIICKENSQIKDLLSAKSTVLGKMYRRKAWQTLMAIYLMGERKETT